MTEALFGNLMQCLFWKLNPASTCCFQSFTFHRNNIKYKIKGIVTAAPNSYTESSPFQLESIDVQREMHSLREENCLQDTTFIMYPFIIHAKKKSTTENL